MDFRAVLVLCLLVAQSGCKPLEAAQLKALQGTAKDVRTSIWAAQIYFAELEHHYRNLSCPSLNTTELGGPEQQPVTIPQLSSFKCYMLNVSKPEHALTDVLNNISQYISSMEALTGSSGRVECQGPGYTLSLPHIKYIECLLQLLYQRLNNPTFELDVK